MHKRKHTHTHMYVVYDDDDDDARLWLRNQVNNALTRKNAQISISLFFTLHYINISVYASTPQYTHKMYSIFTRTAQRKHI